MQLAIALLFLLSACGAAADNACPPTEVVKLAELYANPHLHPCQTVSDGFSVAPPTGYPTDPQVKAMCASDACRALIKDVFALKPTDCDLFFAGVKLNAYKLARSFEKACKAGIDHEDGKYQPTPKPTENKHYPTPKPTDDKYSTPKPKNDHHDKREPKIIKEDMSCPTRSAEKEIVKEADELKPPMNGTAAEFFPMPNTTYKASVPKAEV